MRGRRIHLAPCLTLCLALLASPGAALAMSAGPKTPCGMEKLDHILGQPWSEDLIPPRDGRVRVLRPGDMMTMDHLPDRLNVHLDTDDRVAELRCG